MEAFIVTPAPPRTTPSPNSSAAEHNGNEASFAPALSQAITNRKSSSAGKQESSSGKPSPTDSKETAIKTDTNLPENIAGEGEEPAPVSSGQPTQDTARQLIASFTGPPEVFSGIGKEQAPVSSGQTTQDTVRLLIASPYSQTGRMSLFQTGEMNNPTNSSNNQQGLAIPTLGQGMQTPGQGMSTLPALKNLTKNSANLSAEAIRAMDTAANGNSLLSRSARAALQVDGAAKVAVEPQGTLSTQSSGKIPELFSKHDSIAWHQGEQKVPHAIIQNHALLPTQFEQGILSPKNSLSPEKIIAHLTDLSMQNGNTSLREKPLILRQDLNSQFFNAKIQQENANSEQKSGQQFLQGEQDTGKQNNLTQSFKTTSSPAETSFSQSLHTIAADKSPQLPIEQMRPAIPFSNASVSENEILQQVAQKFRISQHLQNSRIVMRLHPAELGNMKVDIHLKDGTINASIQVQSRQVLEVLEKNMPRLKEMMEQQGLRIDEIVLNIDKDMPADHNLFEDQLAQNENSFFNRKKSTSHISFNLNSEDPTAIHEEESNSSQAAVNVTI